ncbi:hypothetical protein BDF20DRAFT_909652 [Mycotypha africana]|uniref:uncharacterized protein n=1 Tax=Mycotypha africana TaxID=64632 RepID=UPI002300BD34|nr:uncharacterized protein BDF20DRAFT_909652 [Mycotypha africana]KAI8991947.1 hypothetical protein BDF20DRAFT_909652 [Mycotypha africana]
MVTNASDLPERQQLQMRDALFIDCDVNSSPAASLRCNARYNISTTAVHDGQRERFVAKLLYEAPDVAAYLRSQQITSIVHSTLTSGSVIFKFPSKIFGHYTDAYRLITDQLGPVLGGFNPISLRSTRPLSDLIIATKFKSDDANTKAISHGVTVEHVTYKASRFVDKVDTTFTRVNLTLFQFEDEATLISKLKKSMAIYGKVCQIKMLTNRGFFESELAHKERPTDSPTHSSTINDESGLIIPKKAKRYATRSTTAKASVDHTLSPFNTPTGTAGSKYASITVAASMALDEPATPASSDANTSSATTPLHSRLTPAHTDDMDLIIDADTTPPNIVMTAQEGNE